MKRRFYLFENKLFNYDGTISRLKNYEIKQGKTKQMVYSVTKKGKKFLGYVSKMPEKLRKPSERKIKDQFRRNIKKYTDKVRSEFSETRKRLKEKSEKQRAKQKNQFSRESVRAIGESLRDGHYYINIDNTELPILSQNLQSAINFDWILKKLKDNGLLTPEKIKDRKNKSYRFTTVSRWERDLFNTYMTGDEKTKSKLWD